MLKIPTHPAGGIQVICPRVHGFQVLIEKLYNLWPGDLAVAFHFVLRKAHGIILVPHASGKTWMQLKEGKPPVDLLSMYIWTEQKGCLLKHSSEATFTGDLESVENLWLIRNIEKEGKETGESKMIIC